MGAMGKRIPGLEDRLSQLLGRADELRKSIKELEGVLESLRGERNRLNESVRSLRVEAMMWRGERDKANLEAAELMRRVRHHYEELRGMRMRLEELEALLRKRGRPRPKREIRSKITRLEWEVSTTPTLEMLPREKDILEKAKRLYRELRESEELEEEKNKALILLSEIKAIEIRIGNLKDDIKRLKEVSRERNEKMFLLYVKADGEKKKANNIHSKIIDNVSKLKNLREELRKVLGEINEVKSEIRSEKRLSEAERRLLIMERKKEIMEKVKRKLESGGKITLEELKILYEEDREDTDET